MSLRTWWQQRQRTKAKRYLTAHETLALDVLRHDTELASKLVLQAAANAPDRQTLLYPVLSHMGRGASSPLTNTIAKSTPYNLRRFSETPAARRAINAITDPIVELPWQIELIPPVDVDRAQPVPKPTAEQHARIVAASALFSEPNTEVGWRTFLEEAVEDMLVYGAASIEVASTRDPQHPLFLWTVDTQSIRINAKWDGDPRSYRYAQSLGLAGLNISTQEVVQLRDEDLLYIKLNPRTNTPFGLGCLEVAFAAVNAFLGAFDYAEQRASNSTPNYIIFLGEHITIDEVRRWQHYWENEIEGRGKVPIIGGGAAPNVMPLTTSGQDPLWLQWQEFLLRVIAISFGVSPQKLGIERDVNRSTAEVSQTNDWASIAPVAQALEQAFTRQLLHKRLGWTDLRFAWRIQESDTLRQANVLKTQYDMNAIMIDEIREVYERPPLADGLGQMTKSAYEAKMKLLGIPPEPAAPEDEEEEDESSEALAS